MKKIVPIINIKLEDRDKFSNEILNETEYIIKLVNLVYQFHFLNTEQIYRFFKKSTEKRNPFLDKTLIKLWRSGYVEKFKALTHGSFAPSNFYIIGLKGKELLLKNNFSEYDLNTLENYKIGYDVKFAHFEHHYLVSEFASMEFMIWNVENEIAEIGEMKSHVIYGEEKNLIISPDFTTIRKKGGIDITILNEMEVAPKSDQKKRLKLTKYLNYKKQTNDQFILRFIFSNPMREIAYWNWVKKELPEALEVLDIYSTSLNFVENHIDLEREIYFLPKIDTIPKYPLGINRYDERLEVKRIKI